MAFYDWNHNGENDLVDDFMEYQIYKDSTNSNNYTPRGGSGISTFGAVVATIGGLFLGAGIIAFLGGGEDTPVILTIIMWIICSAGLGVWFESTGF